MEKSGLEALRRTTMVKHEGQKSSCVINISCFYSAALAAVSIAGHWAKRTEKKTDTMPTH